MLHSIKIEPLPFMVGVKASSTSGDQGVRLAPSKTAPDDEVFTAAYGPQTPP